MEKYNRYKKLVRLVFACIIAGGVVFGYYKYLKHEQKRIAHEMTKEYNMPDNEYTLKYAEYTRVLSQIYDIYETDELLKEDLKYRITRVLDKLSIDKANKLFISCPASCEEGLARFIIDNSNGCIEEEKRYWIEDYHWENIKVQPCPMGAWQMYLLMNSYLSGPLFGHSLYGYITYYHSDRKHFVNTVSEYGFGGKLDESLRLALDTVELHQPTVVYNDSTKVADVSVMYWSDWGGLIEESVRVEFLPDSTATCKASKPRVLIEYDCGVLF